MKNAFLTAVCLLTLSFAFGCATKPETLRAGAPGHVKAGATAHLSVGMPKEEVLAKFGPPKTVSATADGEVLSYVEELPCGN